jgi:hypothetical protein
MTVSARPLEQARVVAGLLGSASKAAVHLRRNVNTKRWTVTAD